VNGRAPDASSERGLIAWFTRNTVAANLLMWLIVVAGALTLLFGVKVEIFPEMQVQTITVGVEYPGAAPDEVERGICSPIEEAVSGLTGVKRVTSTATENAGAVSIEVMADFDIRRVLDDVKNRVDAITTFPEQAEKPVVQEVVLRRQVIWIAVAGDAEERVLKRVAEQVRDDLLALPEITQVELANVRPYEISIEVGEEALRRYELSFDEVAQAVRRSSLDLPGGSIKTGGGEVLLRAQGQAWRGPEFEAIVLRTRPDGTRLLLGEVARVVDGFAETDQFARFDGKPAALVKVFRVGEQSALDIANAVYRYVADAQRELPAGLSLTTWRDDTRILQSRMSLLARNAISGLILVFVVLALFLRFKLAFWVSLGIPISFLGAIALMPTFGVSLNMISLFAFIVVLGIVVDDAIVVGENVYDHLQRGTSGVVAAILGSKEVAMPVTFSVLTTVAAFVPMFNVAGNAREIWRQIPLIVVPCLLFSLLESKLVLPAHLSHEKPTAPRGPARGLARLWRPIESLWLVAQAPFTRGLQGFVSRVYAPFLEGCLRWRYATVAAALAVFVFTIAWGVTRVRFDFFPAVEGDNVVAAVTMPQGTSAEDTERAVRDLERAALELRDELNGSGTNVVEHLLASVGDQPYTLEQAQNRGRRSDSLSGAHVGEVNVQLAPSEAREISADGVARRWRAKIGAIPGAEALTFSSALISIGADIDVQLAADDIGMLRAGARALQARLATYAGVSDIADSFAAGKREMKLAVQPSAEALGITLADLARQVRQGFYGEEAQRIQRDRDDVKVMVRYPEHERRALASLEDMRVRTAGGDEVPFGAVAQATWGRGFASIRRTDRARTINVTANVDENVANANEILADLRETFLPVLAADHPGLRWSFEGDAREQNETLMSLAKGFLAVLFAIYALLAVPFRSYIQPLLVMTAIPFGLIGATWGHVGLGLEFSIMSMLGLVALAGVVVNDNLVMVDYINGVRAEGRGALDAAREAGTRRFRPILLTTLTTCAGLTPLLLERSVQARFLIPMAVSLAFGVLFATLISLLLVPAGYLVLEDARRAGRWLLGREEARGE
jgi:multidrug efflux pump subunit AcrB